MEKVEYIESRATTAMHDLPRFGYPNNFAYLFGSQQQRSEYIYGLLFAGCFILAFFFVWTILLAVFKCLGERKIGFLSGSPMKVSDRSKKPLIIRITFIFAAITLVAFASTLVTEGLTQLRNGVGTVYSSTVELDRILADVDAFLSSIETVGGQAGPLTDELVSRLGNESFCPGVDLEAMTGQDFDAIIQNATDVLESLGNFSSPELEEAKITVEEAQETNGNAQTVSDNITPSDWQSLIFIVPFSLFAVLFLVGVALAWGGIAATWYTCFLTWVVLPLFIILVIICFLLAGAIAIAASANADFCAGGESRTPEGTITDMLIANGVTEEDLTYQVVTFYIEQCSTRNPLDFLQEYEKDLEQADEAVMQFEEAVANVTVGELAAICGKEDFGSLQALAETVVTRLADLVDAAQGFLAAISCASLIPLYTVTFYNGTCEYSVEGVTWTFASFLVISVMGLLMITFRTAYFPTQEADAVDKQFEATPLSYQEEYEVEYDPSASLAAKESAEDYGLEEEQASNNAGEVATGIAVGAAAGAAVGGATGTSIAGSSMNDETVDTFGQSSANKSQDAAPSDANTFDDPNWLNQSPPTDEPVGSQY